MKFDLNSSKINIKYLLKIVSYLLYFFAVFINITTKIGPAVSFLNWIIVVVWVTISIYTIKKNFGAYASVSIFLGLVIFQVSDYEIDIIIAILHINNIVAMSLTSKNILKSRFWLVFVNFLGIWISVIIQNELLFVILNLLLILNIFTGSVIKMIILRTRYNIGRSVKKPFLIPNSFFGTFLLAAQTLAILILGQVKIIEFKSLWQSDNIVSIILVLTLYLIGLIQKGRSLFNISCNILVACLSLLFLMSFSIEVLFIIAVSLVIYKKMLDSVFKIKSINQRINLYIIVNTLIFVYSLASNQTSILLYTSLFITNLLEVTSVRNKIYRVILESNLDSQVNDKQFKIEQLEIFSQVINSKYDPYKSLKYYELNEFNITNHYEIYLNYGWKYGYSISEIIPEYWYQSELKRMGFLYPSISWITKDLSEEFQIMPEIDSNWMKSKYSLQSPTRYYLAQGWKEGLSPNPRFDFVHSYNRPVFHSMKDALNSICGNRFG
jgi:hypothetical protein